ncbi:hypothetical protein K1719_003525 [Acacia pycnantha]|nr:hypothetical protein K1719_003525 [Acacia pycnantha]
MVSHSKALEGSNKGDEDRARWKITFSPKFYVGSSLPSASLFLCVRPLTCDVVRLLICDGHRLRRRTTKDSKPHSASAPVDAKPLDSKPVDLTLAEVPPPHDALVNKVVLPPPKAKALALVES